MIEIGEVVSAADGKVTVRFARTSACGNCTACGMREDQTEVLLEFEEEGLSVGGKVRVEMPSGGFAVSVLILYGIPLLMLFAGLLIGLAVFSGPQRELLAALTALGATALTYGVIKFWDHKLKKARLFQPRLIKKEEII